MENTSRRTAARTTAKEAGRFCTPDWLTRRIVAETLGPMLRRRSREEILSLRVLDPAMGDGNFLTEAGRLLCEEITKRAPTRSEREHGGIRRRVFSNCLFGVDSDARSVDAARGTLAENGAAQSGLSRHLVVGNSLLDPFPIRRARRFDVILSNPPYVGFKTWSKDEALRARLKRDYECFDWHADLFYFFVELGLKLLAPGGRMGLVTSRYFMRSPSAAKLRRIALPHLAAFHDLSDTDAFSDLGIHCAVSIYEQSCVNAKSVRPCSGGGPDVPTVPLADVAHVRAGSQSGRDRVFVKSIAERDGHFFGTTADGKEIELEAELVHPFIKNRDIQPYDVCPSRYCLFIGDLTPGELRRRCPNAYRFLRSHKRTLLARRSSFKKVTERNWVEWMHWADVHFARERIVCPYRATCNRFALAPAGALGSIDVGFIAPFDVHPMFLLALLNSKVLERVYHGYAKELARGVYDYYPRNLSRLPIRRIEFATPPEKRQEQVAAFRRALQRGRASSWLRARRTPDVLHDVLIVLATEMAGGRRDCRAWIEQAVETLYRS